MSSLARILMQQASPARRCSAAVILLWVSLEHSVGIYPDNVNVYTPRLPTHSHLPSPWVYDPWDVSHAFGFLDPPAAGPLLTCSATALRCDLTFQSYFLYTLPSLSLPSDPYGIPPPCILLMPPPLTPSCPSIRGSGPGLSGYSCPSVGGERGETPPEASILFSSLKCSSRFVSLVEA